MKNFTKGTTERENFLLTLLNKVIQEYRALLDSIHKVKSFKIIEIDKLSSIPGETVFLLQLAHKNCAMKLTAGQIIQQGCDLKLFSDFHANLIRKAAQGKIIEFLNQMEEPENRVTSKIFSREHGHYLFKIENKDGISFMRTADEIAMDKELLRTMGLTDICDVFYTQGSESVINEKIGMLMARKKANK